jgi:hypothetical protein
MERVRYAQTVAPLASICPQVMINLNRSRSESATILFLKEKLLQRAYSHTSKKYALTGPTGRRFLQTPPRT